MKNIKKYLSKKWVAIAWTLLVIILLAIPGKMIPQEQAFTIPQFDKVVHIILFGLFVWLWSNHYSSLSLTKKKLLRIFFLIFIFGVCLGIGMEYVQKYFIPNRDFDEADIIADMIGAGLAYGICNISMLAPE
ncbi:MAG: VanZ family protein [Chitinophagales bacterium]